MEDYSAAKRYTIEAGDLSVTVSDFGATVLGICTTAADGSKKDVVLGYDNFEAYAKGTCYHGGCIGRNGNRIEGGRFILNGRVIQLPVNENTNNLHSGPDGFERRLWIVDNVKNNAITFSLHSPDGDQGFPGNMDIRVTYEVSANGSLAMTFEGVSDEDTVFNMVNHSYFNLNGHDSGSICDHMLTLDCDAYSEVKEGSIPTGRHIRVEGTAFDFRTPHAIGERIGEDDGQLKLTGGYDHNFFGNGMPGEFRKIADAYSPVSGIRMEVFTDLPCVQFYAGNFIAKEKGKGGAFYGPREGFCLETQYCPDAVNQPSEIQPFIKAGQKACSRTTYKFSTCG